MHINNLRANWGKERNETWVKVQDNHRGGSKSQSKTQETTDRVKQEITQKINSKHRQETHSG